MARTHEPRSRLRLRNKSRRLKYVVRPGSNGRSGRTSSADYIRSNVHLGEREYQLFFDDSKNFSRNLTEYGVPSGGLIDVCMAIERFAMAELP